jgi:hypothetical protein
MHTHNHFTSYNPDPHHQSRRLDCVAGIDEAFDDLDQQDIESLIDAMHDQIVLHKSFTQ